MNDKNTHCFSYNSFSQDDISGLKILEQDKTNTSMSLYNKIRPSMFKKAVIQKSIVLNKVIATQISVGNTCGQLYTGQLQCGVTPNNSGSVENTTPNTDTTHSEVIYTDESESKEADVDSTGEKSLGSEEEEDGIIYVELPNTRMLSKFLTIPHGSLSIL